MSSIDLTEEEYLRLVRRFTGEQYDQLDDYESDDSFDPFAKSDLELLTEQAAARKERMFQSMNQGTIDLTKVKRDKLLSSLFKHNNIKVYDFTIRIIKYHGEPNKTGANLNVDITLYHERTKTQLSGAPCRMIETFNIEKDSRFSACSWLKQFSGCHGKNLTPDILVDVIRWMQVAKKLPAFL